MARSRRGALTLLALLAPLALPAGARAAGTVEVRTPEPARATVVFTAADAISNDVAIAFTSAGVVVRDDGDVIQAPGCEGSGTNTVSCPIAERSVVDYAADLRDRDDRLSVFGGAPGAVSGGAGTDQIRGGDGNELLSGGDGPDVIEGNAGDDVVDVVDGFQDLLRCGPGADRVAADQFDALYDCETVAYVRARAGGADLAAPRCALLGARSRARRRSFLKGQTVSFRCNEPVSYEARLVGTVKGLSRVRFSRVADLVLAQVIGKYGSGRRKMRLKPSKRLVRALGTRAFRVSLRIIIRDEYGNLSSLRKRIRVGASPRR